MFNEKLIRNPKIMITSNDLLELLKIIIKKIAKNTIIIYGVTFIIIHLKIKLLDYFIYHFLFIWEYLNTNIIYIYT
jgi:hypothetical protein